MCPCDAHRLNRIISKSMTHKCYPERCFKKKDGTIGAPICKYGYPFLINNETHIDDRGRVNYRRRKDADVSVVSYSPSLCLKFNAHINVDIAHTTM